MVLYEKARMISKYSQDWLRMNRKAEAKPADLMPYLIEMGVFSSDHRNGLPLRDILRKLEEKGELYLIKGAYFEQKKINKSWFIKLKS